MAKPFPDDTYLSRGFEPIRMECDCADLVIEGEMPADLEGSYYRVGPNPQFAPRGPYNPLAGDGMVHAFHIRSGRASYSAHLDHRVPVGFHAQWKPAAV